MFTKALLLADFLLKDEADCRIQGIIHERSAWEARCVALLYDTAEHLIGVRDDDPMIVRMDRAHYFTSGICVPGIYGVEFVQDFYLDDLDCPQDFLKALDQAAQKDEMAWLRGSVPEHHRHLGWFGTSGTHTAEFGS